MEWKKCISLKSKAMKKKECIHLSAKLSEWVLKMVNCEELKQDGRLASAYFSPNYKYLDQLLQPVKNKTTVLNLVFKEFLQTSIPPLISVLYAEGYHDFPLKNFCLTVPKIFVEEPFCVSQNFCYRKILRIRGGTWEYHDFRSIFLSHSAAKFRSGTL